MKDSIQKKFILNNIFITILVLVGGFLFLNRHKDATTIEVYKNIATNLQMSIKDRILAKKAVGISNAVSIANDGKIKNALKTNNRQEALDTLGYISKKMKKSTPFKNIKVHVHTKDNHSFVRASALLLARFLTS